MLNFPIETFWYIVPWPFIWLILGIVMFFIHHRNDKLEDKRQRELTKMNSDVIIFVVYLLVLLGIGLYFSRKASLSSESYLLGGREVGPAVTALTMQSTSMSGFMFLGGPALAFQHGWFAI